MGAKFCQECGTKLAEGAKFCPECGAKINQGETKPEPLFDFSDDTAKYGGADFGGFDAQFKNKQQAQTRNQAEEEEALKLAIELYNAEKYDKAVPVFKKYAEKGNKVAQFYLGTCYGCAYGVIEDQEKWLYWIQKSAEQGYADAQFQLGQYYENDDDGIDYQKAAYWYKKAADQGDNIAKSFLESLKKQQQTPVKAEKKPVEEELDWALRFADLENIEESKKSFVILKKYAEKGNADAQCALAYAYLTGDSLCSYGVPVDKKQAYYWFKKAADQGDETAKDEIEHWGRLD